MNQLVCPKLDDFFLMFLQRPFVLCLKGILISFLVVLTIYKAASDPNLFLVVVGLSGATTKQMSNLINQVEVNTRSEPELSGSCLRETCPSLPGCLESIFTA